MSLVVDEYSVVRKVCRSYFFEFLKEFWHTFCSEKPVWNWHIEYLCNEIQEVYERIFRGEKKAYDLVINVPPGSTKSSIASIAAVPWAWTRMPSLRSMNGSHTQDLVMELSRKSREIIYSEYYNTIFPGIELSQSQNTKGHWANTKGGGRLCCTVGGKSPLGFHAHVHTVDDPIDPKKALSDIEIENANTWLIETLSTRKVDKAITPLILIMQRLSQNDPSGYMLENFGNRIRHICLPAELTDHVKPAELAYNYQDNLLDPIRISEQVLEEEREKNDYYYCTPGFTPILMADWTEKNIADVEIGDNVVGYVLGGNRKRAKIVPAVVMKKSVSKREVVRITMESGREVYCTPDHKWWTQRLSSGKWGNRASYLQARVGKNLFSVYEPLYKPTAKEQRMLDWLGGMIDGDGGRSGNYITISQSPTANPVVFKRIEKVLSKLKIPFSVDRRFRDGGCFSDGREVQSREESGTFVLHGGRYTKMRLVNNCYCAKKNVILQAIWDQPGFVAERKDKVVSIESVGEMEVFGLTTTSGNYVAWGYASQNSGQFLQNPIPIGGGMFKTDMLNIAPSAPSNIHFTRIVRSWDNAGSPKKGSADRRRKRTAGVKIGAHKDGSYWILDVRKGRWKVHQRELIKKISAQQDGYDVEIIQEQEGGSGGQESAEQTVRNLAGYRVKIFNPSGKGDKTTKAEPLASQVNIGNVYLVQDQWNKDFIEEMKHFPYSTFKDQIDAAAQGFNEVYKPRRRVGPLFSTASS